MNLLVDKLKDILSEHNYELFRKSFSSGVLKVVGMALGYIFTFVITRLFSAESNGILSLSIILFQFLTLIGVLGFDLYLVRYMSGKIIEDNVGISKSVYNKTLLISFMLSSLVSLVFYFTIPFFLDYFENDKLQFPFTVICMIAPVWAMTSVNMAVMRAFKQAGKFTFYLNVGRYLIGTIVLLALYYSDAIHYYYPVLAYAVACVVLMLISFYHVSQILKSVHLVDFSWDKFKIILSRSMPMFMSTFLLFILAVVDRFFLAHYESESAVGIYDVSVKLAMLITFTHNAINIIAAPVFAEHYHSRNKEGLKSAVKFTSRLVFYSSLPVFLILIIFPGFFLEQFGHLYRFGGVSLQILAIGYFVNAGAGMVAVLLMMTDRQKAFQYILMVAIVLDIILNVLLAPEMGMVGVALANAISLITWTVISLFYIKNQFGFTTLINPFKLKD